MRYIIACLGACALILYAVASLARANEQVNDLILQNNALQRELATFSDPFFALTEVEGVPAMIYEPVAMDEYCRYEYPAHLEIMK